MDELFVIQSGSQFLMNGLYQIKIFATRELAEMDAKDLCDPYGRKWEVRTAGFVTEESMVR